MFYTEIIIEHNELSYSLFEGVMFQLCIRFAGCLERPVEFSAATANITALGISHLP